RRIAGAHDARDTTGMALNKDALAEADWGVGDEASESDIASVIQVRIEGDADKDSAFRVRRHIRNHDRTQRLTHVRPAIKAAVDGRAEVKRLERKGESRIAEVVQPDNAQ